MSFSIAFLILRGVPMFFLMELELTVALRLWRPTLGELVLAGRSPRWRAWLILLAMSGVRAPRPEHNLVSSACGFGMTSLRIGESETSSDVPSFLACIFSRL
jgi:hypothetical protein